VWIKNEDLVGFGCSECAWIFRSPGAPVGNSLEEMKRNYEIQRDKEFAAHVCSEHVISTKSK